MYVDRGTRALAKFVAYRGGREEVRGSMCWGTSTILGGRALTMFVACIGGREEVRGSMCWGTSTRAESRCSWV